MIEKLKEELIKDDIEFSEEENVLEKYSEDKSIFRIKPKLVVFPKNTNDIKLLVNLSSKLKFSLTCYSAGTDMSGGALTDSVLLVMTKYFNKILEINEQEKFASVQPGLYFRDFEKEISKFNLMLPSYPASKELCTVGGMVSNNSGGEKSLKYGKTENYVLGLKVVLSDGEEYYLENIDLIKLEQKLQQGNFEGEVYRKIYQLFQNNKELIKNSKPKVSKNSSGYNIWQTFNNGSLDLTKLFTGSQGTLGIITEIKFKLVEKEKFSRLITVFIKDLKNLPGFTREILNLEPTSLEITDDHTFKIFLKFAKEMASLLGARGLLSMFRLFLPEIILVLRMMSFPKLIVLVEYSGDDLNKISEKINQTINISKKYRFLFRVPLNEQETEKYWRLRRDTYRLLREKIKNRLAAPFIDDFIIPPEKLNEFLPKLYQILNDAQLIYTISGHLGDGNLHIIPLIDMKTERSKILEVNELVYDLVLNYHGLLSAEHNDGLIRGPYLEKEYGPEVFKIFREIKFIFDPENIFNPYKKVTALKENIVKYLKIS